MKTIETPVLCLNDLQYSWQIEAWIEKFIATPLRDEGIKFEIIGVPPQAGLQGTIAKLKITLP